MKLSMGTIKELLISKKKAFRRSVKTNSKMIHYGFNLNLWNYIVTKGCIYKMNTEWKIKSVS